MNKFLTFAAGTSFALYPHSAGHVFIPHGQTPNQVFLDRAHPLSGKHQVTFNEQVFFINIDTESFMYTKRKTYLE